MLTDKLKEETRIEMYFFLGLLLLILVMLLLNIYLNDGREINPEKKEKNKTVIIREMKNNTDVPKSPPKTVVASVAEVIKQIDYSTAYMEINHTPKNSPEYKELNKILAEENLKRKAPAIRREGDTTSGGLVRYLDESTPRDRSANAMFVYFVDIAGTFFPSFCIQSNGKTALGITEYIISADNRNIKINAPAVKTENIGTGVAEWYDAPLDKQTYTAVQALLNAKKVVTLTAVGKKGKTSRNVTDNEIKGIRRVLDGYTALGGTLNYMQEIKVPLSDQKNFQTGKKGQ